MALAPPQTYATAAETRAYALARGITVSAEDDAVDVLLVRALDYLELLNYKGSKTDEEQVLSWPRTDVCINGVIIDDESTPARIKQAQMVAAIAAQTINLMPNTAAGAPGQVIQKSIPGAISVTYASPSAGVASRYPSLPQLDALLADYLEDSRFLALNIFPVRA